MKYNFKQIFAVATSALLVGMTAGVAGAANYPQPFVTSGLGDFAVVHGGSNADVRDATEAKSIATQLSGLVSGGSIDFGDEVVSLDSSNTRIYLNTSLIVAKSSLTKSNLPVTLADTSFNGANTTTQTHTLKFFAGGTDGNANSGRVIFAKEPTSSDDPSILLSMGTSYNSNILYNATVTMGGTTFNHADSEGEEITLFGQDFTVSTETDADKIVLFKGADKATLSLGGSAPNPSTTVSIGGSSYEVTLVSADSSSALVSVNGGSANSINSGSSKKVGGITIAVTNIVAGSDSIGTSATILIGADKMTFETGQPVTVGENEDQIDGTRVYLVGGPDALTELTVSVYAPDSSDDAILSGTSLVDPVFGTFKVGFEGVSSPIDDSARDTIKVDVSGDNDLVLTMTEQDGNEKTLTFAHNGSSTGPFLLSDSNNFSIGIQEMANLSYKANGKKYVVVGNEDYGRLLELTNVKNSSGTDSAKQTSTTYNDVTLKDVFSGDTYNIASWTSSGVGTTESIDGKQYTVYVNNSQGGENAYVQLKYPTSDSSGRTVGVFFPTIETPTGAKVMLYEPLTVDLGQWEGNSFFENDLGTILIPDGDGYADPVTVSFNDGNDTQSNWTVGGQQIMTGSSLVGGVNGTILSIGQLRFHVNGTTTVNETTFKLDNPEGGAVFERPAIAIFEGKDDDSNYEVVVVTSEIDGEGVGVNDVLFSSPTKWEDTRASDSKLRDHVTWYGTHALRDDTTSGQKFVTITHPGGQVYANLKVGSVDGVTATTQVGSVVVTDAEVASVQSKNLVVVGGSCVNSVAATLVGGQKCGSDWTSTTSVGSGQWLIQSYANPNASGKVALLVAGYEVADTMNAATYLKNQNVDTTVGKKYVGSTATQATSSVVSS